MEKILHQLIGSLSHDVEDFHIPDGAGSIPSTIVCSRSFLLKKCGLSIFVVYFVSWIFVELWMEPNMTYLPRTWVAIVEDGGTNATQNAQNQHEWFSYTHNWGRSICHLWKTIPLWQKLVHCFFLNMTSTISVRSQVRSWVGVKKMVRISSQSTCPSLSWRFSRRFKGCRVWLRDFWLEHFLKMSMYSLFLGWVFHRRTGYIL